MRRFLGTIFSLYLFAAVIIATPYFNWRYAKEHGFVSWIAFGEVIATAKAIVWPYFMITNGQVTIPEEYRESNRHYKNSKSACDKALAIVIREGSIEQLDPSEREEMSGLFVIAINEAEKIEDKYLRVVHPEFETRYKKQYIEGMRNMVSGLGPNSKVLIMDATIKYNEFTNWVKDHLSEMRFH